MTFLNWPKDLTFEVSSGKYTIWWFGGSVGMLESLPIFAAETVKARVGAWKVGATVVLGRLRETLLASVRVDSIGKGEDRRCVTYCGSFGSCGASISCACGSTYVCT